MQAPHDIELSVNLLLKCGWVVQKIHARAGNPQVKLDCYYLPKGWHQEVYLDLETGIFMGYLFPPFHEENAQKLAERVLPIVAKSLPAQVLKQEKLLQSLRQLKDEMTNLHVKKWQEKHNPPPSSPPPSKP